MVSTLVELGSTPTLPLKLVAEIGLARRQVMWQNTVRARDRRSPAGCSSSAPRTHAQLVGQARASGAEGCLLISEVELDDAAEAEQRAASPGRRPPPSGRLGARRADRPARSTPCWTCTAAG